MQYGVLESEGVRFERRYAAPVAELWAAWTDPVRLGGWLEARVDGVAVPGGELRLVWSDDPDQQASWRVRAADAPSLLEFEWDSMLVRVRLTADHDGTSMVLQHTQVAPGSRASYAAGWHAHLAAFDGLGDTDWQAEFDAALTHYRQLAERP